MFSSPSSSNPLLTSTRVRTLVVSLLVALGSGTNYAYSAYAPQLGARLHISHTQLNIIALAGNVGVYSTGPIWGRLVDTRGPKIPLTFAFLFLLSGYSGIRHFFDAGVPKDAPTISDWTFGLLVLCGYLTGAGGNGGLTSSVNSTAKSFPDRARASATGLVIGGFGLSAFIFSSIAKYAFPGNTSSFLLLLALGTASPMILGWFFVKPVPFHEGRVSGGEEAADISHRANSRTRLLDAEENPLANSTLSDGEDEDEEVPLHSTGVDVGGAEPRHRRSYSLERNADHSLHDHNLPNIFGSELITNGDFWLLFSILSIVSGTGLMYINNVGSMSQALYAQGNPNYDEKRAAVWQAQQVSSISLMNFTGRIFIGLVADFTKTKLGLPRSYCIVLVAFFAFISQVTAARIDTIENLWMASALLGLAHGSAFSLFPTMTIEWFGMPHFSENWGYVSMSPMFGGNIFSLIFGRNLDAHETVTPTPELLVDARHICLQGRLCYVDALYVTAAACFFAMGLSVWAGYRDKARVR
ncbi:hypothetical protein AX16_003223 [Volvariella volvacea WC 439]|nr:hypothetical protein AX16_003223 [Volvariella volvacea WC 439]